MYLSEIIMSIEQVFILSCGFQWFVYVRFLNNLVCRFIRSRQAGIRWTYGTLPLKVVITLLENVAATSLNVATDVDGKFVANMVQTMAHNVGKTLAPNVDKTLDV